MKWSVWRDLKSRLSFSLIHVNAAVHYSPSIYGSNVYLRNDRLCPIDEIWGKSKEQIYDYLRPVKQVPWTSDVYYLLVEEVGHEVSQSAGSMALSSGSELDYNAA